MGNIFEWATLKIFSIRKLRALISVVTQKKSFDDTIFHNITLGENTRWIKILEYTEDAWFEDFIQNLNGGLNFQDGPGIKSFVVKDKELHWRVFLENQNSSSR